MGFEERETVVLDINKYVSQLLFRKELMAQIEMVFEKGGYGLLA